MPLKGTVWRVFPLIALIALGGFFHSTPGSAHHPFQNHCTHEISIFELFRDYSYSFQGSAEVVRITVTVSLFF